MTDNPTEQQIIRIPMYANGGQPTLGVEGLALLYGIPVDEIRRWYAVESNSDATEWMPLKLRKQARRRVREAVAATGIDSLQSALEYWAEKEHGAQIRLVLGDDPE